MIEPAVTAGKDFWYVPQLHGEYNRDQGQYRIPGRTILRPPTGLEIKASVWLAVAFGAKGIIGYPYGTHEWTDGVDAWTYTGLLSSDTGSDGIRRDHSANTATIDGSTVYTGYSEKWKGYKGVLAKLKDLGPTLASLHWQGAFYRRTWGTSMPAQFQMVGATTVTNVTTSDPAADTFVEVAHLKDDASVDYLVVVNLRTLASDARDVRVFFNGPKLVSRVGSDSSWFVGSGGSFVDRIAPGDGNLYKVEALNIAMTFGHVPSIRSISSLRAIPFTLARVNHSTLRVRSRRSGRPPSRSISQHPIPTHSGLVSTSMARVPRIHGSGTFPSRTVRAMGCRSMEPPA